MVQALIQRAGVALLVLAASTLCTTSVSAQTPTGSITGRVTDSSGLPVPGATVTIQSTHLQGTRTAVTSENGDYLLPALPPGPYTITVELSGFATSKQTRDVGTGQPVGLDVTLRPESLSEVVNVVARADAFTNTVQASTNIQHDLLSTLPTARTLLSAVNLAPAVHATGPSNAVTIGGAMSFENLFMLDGVQISDNIRGTPFTLFIEDAIQETTVSTSGISAEYGRFTGGVVNAITKSGGNQFSGSLRTTFANDDWRTVSPFDEPKTNDTVPTYEFTLGGPILRNRTWFFGAGRFFDQVRSNETGFTRVPYAFENDEKRFEGKITQSLANGHTVRAAYAAIRETEVNNVWPSPQEVMDLRSLHTRELPQDRFSLHYAGTLKPNLFLEAPVLEPAVLVREFRRHVDRPDRRHGASRSAHRRLVVGPELLRRLRPGGAGQLEPVPEGELLPVDAARLAQRRLRVRHVQRPAQGRQPSVGQRLSRVGDRHDRPGRHGLPGDRQRRFHVHRLVADHRGEQRHELPHALAVRQRLLEREQALHVQSRPALGQERREGRRRQPRGERQRLQPARRPRLRSDRRRALGRARELREVRRGAGQQHRRFGVAGRHAVDHRVFLSRAPASTRRGGPLVASDAALQQVFGWFNGNGGTNRDPFFTSIPGVKVQIRDLLKSPHANEFATGLSRQLGSHGAIRADFVYRDFNDFYTERVDTSTGQVTDANGNVLDLVLVENTNVTDRQYTALSTQVNYRIGSRINIGGNYTLSKLWGNVNGETINSGPVTSSVLSYPEFIDLAWFAPEGNLSADQRHRVRLWGTWQLPMSERFGTSTLGVLEQTSSGTPYGASRQHPLVAVRRRSRLRRSA